jgi:hypothetical protein
MNTTTTNEATDADIINFFRDHDFTIETEDGEEAVQSVGDCHQALSDALEWAICDPKEIIRGERGNNPDGDPDELLANYFAALRSPAVAAQREESWFADAHRAAAYLNTTVKDVIEEIDPECFEALRGDEHLEAELIEFFQQNGGMDNALSDEAGKHRVTDAAFRALTSSYELRQAAYSAGSAGIDPAAFGQRYPTLSQALVHSGARITYGIKLQMPNSDKWETVEEVLNRME